MSLQYIAEPSKTDAATPLMAQPQPQENQPIQAQPMQTQPIQQPINYYAQPQQPFNQTSSCSCGAHPKEEVQKKTCSMCQIIACIILLLVFWPLFWIPFVMSNYMDTTVVCKRCGRVKRVQKGEGCC